MKTISNIDLLPRPLHMLAMAFLQMDTHPPEIFEAEADEMSALRLEEEVVFQLILDKSYMRWYLVAVGDQERTKRSEYILHDPFLVKRSILVFAPVDDAWLRTKRHEYDKYMMGNAGEARVWNGDGWGVQQVDFDNPESVEEDELWPA